MEERLVQPSSHRFSRDFHSLQNGPAFRVVKELPVLVSSRVIARVVIVERVMTRVGRTLFEEIGISRVISGGRKKFPAVRLEIRFRHTF